VPRMEHLTALIESGKLSARKFASVDVMILDALEEYIDAESDHGLAKPWS
jgi:hypothetical protein